MNKIITRRNMTKIDKYDVDTGLFYDAIEHYWVKISGNTARVGMSPLIQETSGAFVAVQMKAVDQEFNQGEAFGSIEAEKHVGPLKMPLSGKVLKVNNEVIENPRLINYDPYGEGWIMEMELTNADAEVPELIFGDHDVVQWFESELKKFEDKGWIAN
jgi:glycine cleavage system H protein